MLLLLTIGLVLVATVALVIGFVTSALPPIYVSIACSVAAALVLFFFSRLSKREAQVPTSAGPAPLPGPTAGEAAPAGSTVTVLGTAPPAEEAPAGGAAAAAGSATDNVPDAESTGEVPVVAAGDEAFAPEGMIAAAEPAGGDGASVADASAGAWAESPTEGAQGDQAPAGAPAVPGLAAVAAAAESADEDAAGGGDGAADEDYVFPIADYDDLRVSEILPLLPELDEDELQMVRQREQQGRARFSVLTRVDQLSAQLRSATGVPSQGFEEDATGVGVPSAPLAPPPPPPGPPPGDWPAPPDAPLAPPPAPEMAPAGAGTDTDVANAEMAPADADIAVAAAAGEGQGVPMAEALEGAPDAVAVPAPDVSRAFPIADYDGKKVTEILPLLTNLGADDLAMVAEKERSGKARGSVLSRIEQLQARAADAAPPPTAAKRVVEGAAAKKTAAKKAPAKKAAAGGTKATAGKAASATSAAKSTKAAKAPATKAASAGKTTSAAKAASTAKASPDAPEGGEPTSAADGAEQAADGSAQKAPAKKAPSRSTKKQ